MESSIQNVGKVNATALTQAQAGLGIGIRKLKEYFTDVNKIDYEKFNTLAQDYTKRPRAKDLINFFRWY